MQVKLTSNTISDDDIDALCEFLKQKPRKLTYGVKVKEFEEKFAALIGTKYSVLVNSGSSANLLMISALIERGICKFNKKVVVPALSWATDLAPVMQLGLEPILCDCNLNDLSVDLEHLEKVFREEKPSALLLVSILGLVPDMDTIQKLCDSYHVVLIEDNCESLLSSYKGRNLGTFGNMSSFSLFHAHHISTIEGGVITCNDKETYELLLMLRSHGWDREVSPESQQKIRTKFSVNDFSALYKFYCPGYNVRPTEITGFLGLRQLDNVTQFMLTRAKNYNDWLSNLETIRPQWKPRNDFLDYGTFVSNFAVPIISKNRDKLIELCKENEIECRPLVSGSMSLQPVYMKRYGRNVMKNAEYVDKYGMYIPNNQSMSANEVSFMFETLRDYL